MPVAQNPGIPPAPETPAAPVPVPPAPSAPARPHRPPAARPAGARQYAVCARHVLRAEGRARQQACQRQNRSQFFHSAPHEKAPIPREMPRRIHLQKGGVFSGMPEKRPASFIIIPHRPIPAAQAAYTKKHLCFRQFAKNRGVFLFRGIMRGGRQHTAILHRAPCCRTAPSAGEYLRAEPCAQSPRRQGRTLCRE